MALDYYVKPASYQWANVCRVCYKALNIQWAFASIAGREFFMADASKGGKAERIKAATVHKTNASQTA